MLVSFICIWNCNGLVCPNLYQLCMAIKIYKYCWPVSQITTTNVYNGMPSTSWLDISLYKWINRAPFSALLINPRFFLSPKRNYKIASLLEKRLDRKQEHRADRDGITTVSNIKITCNTKIELVCKKKETIRHKKSVRIL